jgi:hypothetical protein
VRDDHATRPNPLRLGTIIGRVSKKRQATGRHGVQARHIAAQSKKDEPEFLDSGPSGGSVHSRSETV